MRELMIHVERIVRPVRATAGRKLRMRRELLAHLEAALAQERAAGRDESAALEGAELRLGSPEDLRRQLQASVPLSQRVLLGRMPAPACYERWENRAFGFGAAHLTLSQASVVTAGAFVALMGAMFAAAPVIWENKTALRSALEAHATSFVVGNIFAAVVSMAALAFCFKLVAAMVARDSGRRVMAFGGAAFGLLLAWAALITNVVAGQAVSGMEFVPELLAGAALLGALVLLGLVVAAWQQPYRMWMELELAD